ncbi:sodium:calcium antiporter [Natrinema salifodinae]|uniref:Cation:H+ antiporter n=2 Tax=Natrinema salifodinae TaxID=1202768 RepID=A0A1I0NP24_9EURY|nr:sodium:calcium antiporter [Natrinema salifodinae]SEW02637.1 cation:H+ antiporter [Natrinema salifodinae]
MIEVLGLLALAAAGTAVVWKGSVWLEDSANALAASYGLPMVVQGAVVAAAGSSMPELASVLLATLLHGEFELGVGSIVGSAVFNLLVIPGMAVVYGGGIDTTRELVYKEALFYMLAVATLLLTFSLAVIYNPVDRADTLVRGTVSRQLALVPIVLYGLYLFTQYLDARGADVTADTSVDRARSWLWFGLGLVFIIGGVEGLVRAAIGLGDAFGTPSFLWGMTVVAAGSSLPDTFVSMAAAQADRPTVTLANVLGSNTFDLLVAIPVGVLAAGSLTVTFSHVVPMIAFLIAATIFFFAISRTGMYLSRREGWALLALYTAFVCWLLLESLRITSVLEL